MSLWSDRPPLRPQRESEELPTTVAAEQIQYIRDVMARADPFTAVPGWGSVVMGVLALIATVALAPYVYSGVWFVGWMITGIVAIGVGLVALVRKAKAGNMPLASGSGRKFLLGMAPAILAGGVLTAVMARADMLEFLPGIWMLLYGVGVMGSGAFSIRLIPLLGVMIMAGSVPAFLLPGAGPHWVFGGAFSLVHMVVGYLIAQRYGG